MERREEGRREGRREEGGKEGERGGRRERGGGLMQHYPYITSMTKVAQQDSL